MKHLIKIAAALAFLILSGCATSEEDAPIGSVVPSPGTYQNAADWFTGEGFRIMHKEAVFRDMPDQTVRDFYRCLWAYFDLGFTPQQRIELDEFAQGQHSLSDATITAIHRGFDSFGMPGRGNFSKFEPVCHDKIPEFQAQLKS